MQVSPLETGAATYGVCRCKAFFFSSLFHSLDSLDCFQVLDWFCFPLLHLFSTCTMQTPEIPRQWSLIFKYRAVRSEESGLYAHFRLGSNPPRAAYSTSKHPLLVQDPLWQPITIFLPLIYVKWTGLQNRFISSLVSSIDSHWFYLLTLITVSCLNHPFSSSHFIAFKLSSQTFSCTCAFPAAVPL